MKKKIKAKKIMVYKKKNNAHKLKSNTNFNWDLWFQLINGRNSMRDIKTKKLLCWLLNSILRSSSWKIF